MKTHNTQSFEEFCDEKLESFSAYLNNVNQYRINQTKFQNQFSEKELIFLEKHFEITLILAISNLDNIVILKNIHKAQKDWEIKFFAKKMILNIYESLKSLDGNSKLVIQYLCTEDESKEEYFELNKNIRIFKKLYGYDKEISQIRNVTAGHIHNKNFDLYFNTISELNPKKSVEMGIEFMSINANFGAFLLKNLRKNIKKDK